MRNRFPGTCYRCGKRVEAGEGHFEKIKKAGPGPKWRTQHADCAIQYRGTTHSAERPAAGVDDLRRDRHRAIRRSRRWSTA